MYGWRARIALIIAQSNTTMEPEFNLVTPDGVSIHTARVHVGGVTAAGVLEAEADLLRAVEDLSDIDAAVFAYACTSASFVGGVDNDVRQIEEIQAKTGRPFIPAATAVVEALLALGAKRIGVGTPYPPDMNEPEELFLEACGFDVTNVSGINLGGARQRHYPLAASPVSQVGLQPPEVAYRVGRLAYREGVEAILLSGANLPTLEVIDLLETDLGVPVITSSQATIWAALQLAGIREPIEGYGRLLALPACFPAARYRSPLAAVTR